MICFMRRVWFPGVLVSGNKYCLENNQFSHENIFRKKLQETDKYNRVDNIIKMIITTSSRVAMKIKEKQQ